MITDKNMDKKGFRVQNLDSEKNWHEQDFYINSDHWTSNPLFASRKRHWLCVHTEKIRFYGFLARYLRNKRYRGSAKILIAPVGTGNEIEYLDRLVL